MIGMYFPSISPNTHVIALSSSFYSLSRFLEETVFAETSRNLLSIHPLKISSNNIDKHFFGVYYQLLIWGRFLGGNAKISYQLLILVRKLAQKNIMLYLSWDQLYKQFIVSPMQYQCLQSPRIAIFSRTTYILCVLLV